MQSLHRSGRTHRAIGLETVTVDEQLVSHVAPGPALRRLGGDCSDPEYCPPDLAEGDALELPASIDAAAAVLQARGCTLDPRRIDIYQLGTLLCRLLTGHSVLSYIAMQCIRGESLSARLASRRRLPVDETLHIVEDCLAGLGAAHARGLIHRDIKPGNILLDSENDPALGCGERSRTATAGGT